MGGESERVSKTLLDTEGDDTGNTRQKEVQDNPPGLDDTPTPDVERKQG